jgi:predicted aconitase
MKLTKTEKDMLEGKRGEGIQKAIEILYALGEIYGAEKMVAVKSAQISGVSYKNLGDAGLEFLEEWAKKGAKVRIPSMMNPAGVDIENWEKLGISNGFAEKQIKLIKAYQKMGVTASCTCTPYLIGNKPGYGDHIAWSESSAVSYANSVLGARTNREGGPSALAAAITGVTPEYGYHLDRNRKANIFVEVKCPVKDIADFGALGVIVGIKAGSKIPYYKFKDKKKIPLGNLKTLGASMAAAGAVALYHIEGVTPEAKKQNMLDKNAEKFIVESLDEGYEKLNSKVNDIDFVAIGCPHASMEELEEIAGLLKGKKVKAKLWITTSREIRKAAVKKRIVEDIEVSGAYVVSDTCMVVAPIEELGFKSMATNAGKAAFYAPSHCNLNVRYGSTKRCIDAAVSGRWD